MLVRHVLSQLSYAPIRSLSASDLSDGYYYTQEGLICQAIFFKFFNKFFSLKPLLIPTKHYAFFNISAISAGVKEYTSSQNWHSTGNVLPSFMI